MATVRFLVAFLQKPSKDLLNRKKGLDLDIKRHHGEDGDRR
jgi:hypothetical protein